MSYNYFVHIEPETNMPHSRLDDYPNVGVHVFGQINLFLECVIRGSILFGMSDIGVRIFIQFGVKSNSLLITPTIFHYQVPV